MAVRRRRASGRPVRIRIYPDASGDSGKSVRASKLTSRCSSKPAHSLAPAADAGQGPDRLPVNPCSATPRASAAIVNPDRVPTYADALEQQVSGTNGEPDKADIDHPNDAGGYFHPQGMPDHEVFPRRCFLMGVRRFLTDKLVNFVANWARARQGRRQLLRAGRAHRSADSQRVSRRLIYRARSSISQRRSATSARWRAWQASEARSRRSRPKEKRLQVRLAPRKL